MDMNDATGLSSFEISLRTGWKDEEKLMLWEEVKKAQKMGAPLKRVFETVAANTGRKPNSVRNYYYMKVKETGEISLKPQAFTPFTKEEIYMLLRSLLAAGAKGESIRGASLKLADGDKTLMLRYQNKYRSLIKSGRALVQKVMADMDSDGAPYKNPYETQRGSAPDSHDSLYISESVVRTLMAADIDIKSFFKGLSKIASSAATARELGADFGKLEEKIAKLSQDNDALCMQIRSLDEKLKRETEKSASVASLFEQFIKINSTFVGAEQMEGLGEWLKNGQASAADAL